MSGGNIYRLRALTFERLAKSRADDELKARLQELARDCSRLAAAIERHPELAAFDDLKRPRHLH